MSDAMASEPLPDTGRKRAKGKSSDGKLRALHTGDKRLVKNSTSPDALKTLMAIKIAKSEGKTPNTDLAPDTAPSQKAEYTLTFLIPP